MKKLLLLISILIFSLPQFLSGQQGWIKEITPSDSVNSNRIVETTDGNIAFAIRAFEGLGSGLGTGNYLIKSDLDGNYIWTKKFSEETSSWSTRQLISTIDNGFLIRENRLHQGSYKPYFTKLDENGDKLWGGYFSFGSGSVIPIVEDVVETNDGEFYILHKEMLIRKVDSNFNEIWTFEKPNGNFYSPKSLSKYDNDEFVALSEFNDGSTIQHSIIKLDAGGNEILETITPINQYDASYILSLSDGGFMVFNSGLGSSNTNVAFITRFDNSGNVVWEKLRNDLFSNIPNQFFHQLVNPVQVSDGFVFSSRIFNGGVSYDQIFLVKIGFDGDIIWRETLNALPSGGSVAPIIGVGNDEIIGIANVDTYTGTYFHLFKTNAEGLIFPNVILGNVGLDEQPNCVIDTNEVEITNWMVTASNNIDTFYSITNNLGEYKFSLDTGDYVLSIHPPNNLWTPCGNDIDINLTSDTIIEKDFPMEAVVICPSLTVNGSLSRARPCFTNRFHVNYANQGTDKAENAYIEIEVDSNFTYMSSSINLAAQNGNTYTFDLGDISIGESGSFSIDYFLDCDMGIGESVCIASHIYPDSICLPNPNWSGAFVEVDAHCQDSTIQFYLRNTGSADMPQASDYVIIEDAILLFNSEFQLLAGQVDSFLVSTNGATYHMIAEQVENAPGSSTPTTWVEGCVTNGSSNFSIGFINQFPLGDNGFRHLDIDCEITTNSFDPNDKRGLPLGYGDEHFIRSNTDLEYKIRFQNTGTDTAFTVVIRDTIAAELDLTSIDVGPSSHPYSWRIYGENVLEFTFSTIMLPDSNVNEPASNGFVEYKIAQQKDLSDGIVIKNKAAIYFDYNAPVITNETFHTIGSDFVTVSLQSPISEQTRIKVYPNPLQDFAIFEIKKEVKDGVIEIYDVSGKLILQQKFNGKQFELRRNDLKSGIYFYKITDGEQAINSGKIIVK